MQDNKIPSKVCQGDKPHFIANTQGVNSTLALGWETSEMQRPTHIIMLVANGCSFRGRSATHRFLCYWRVHLLTMITSHDISANYAHWTVKFCYPQTILYCIHIPDRKIHGANMGPTWALSVPDGPHVGPTNLATRDCITAIQYVILREVCWQQLDFIVGGRFLFSWQYFSIYQSLLI